MEQKVREKCRRVLSGLVEVWEKFFQQWQEITYETVSISVFGSHRSAFPIESGLVRNVRVQARSELRDEVGSAMFGIFCALIHCYWSDYSYECTISPVVVDRVSD